MRNLLLVLLLSAAIPGAADEITLPEALAEAAQNHPDLVAARAALEAAKAGWRAAQSGYGPTASASFDYGRSGSDDFLGSPGQDSYSWGLSARQNLFNGFRTMAAVESARARLEGVQADFESVRAQVSFDLKTAFYNLLYSQEQERLTQAILARRQDNLRLVGLRYNGGREHQGSYLRIKAIAEQAAFEVQAAARAARVAQRRLAQSLGRDPFAVLTVTGTFATQPPAVPADMRVLAGQTPAVRGADADLRAARAAVPSARGNFYPSVDASLGIRRQDENWPPNGRNWSGGVGLSVPLFTSGSNLYNAVRARAERRQSEARRQSVFQDTVVLLEDALASFQDAVGRDAVQQQFLAASDVRAGIARRQYAAGLINFQDWDVIENDLVSAQKDALASRRNVATAEAGWERTQGKGSLP